MINECSMSTDRAYFQERWLRKVEKKRDRKMKIEEKVKKKSVRDK